jgi:hypothetical protein
MNKRYLRWLFRHWKIALIFFSLLYFFLTMTPFITYSADLVTRQHMYRDSMYFATRLAVLIAYGLPLFLFSFVHRTRSADAWFSLPYSRKEQLVTSLLFALIVCSGLFLVSTLCAWGLGGRSVMTLGRQLLIILYMIFSLAVLIGFNTLLYLIGNNLLDGVVMVGAYTLMPVLLSFAVSSLQGMLPMRSGVIDQFANSAYQYFSPVLMMSTNITALVEDIYSFRLWMVAAQLAFGALCWVGLKKEFIERRTERAEHISNSFFSWPFVIRVYVVFLLLAASIDTIAFGTALNITFYLVLYGIYVIAGFVYKRKIQLSLKNNLFYLIALAATLAFSSICFRTHVFGLGNRLPDLNSDSLSVYYYAYVSREDLGSMVDDTYYDGNTDCVQVSFDLRVSPNTIPGLKDRLLAMYENGADLFYSQNTDHNGFTSVSMIDISEDGNTFTTIESWNLSTSMTFSEEELQEISRYGSVTVSWETSSDYQELSLAEYLAQRN